ncbi:MAG: fimbria major subunit [Tannerellaceae bacterium]|nr:fimbria major subunit [Tannerellaceae bacterium]
MKKFNLLFMIPAVVLLLAACSDKDSIQDGDSESGKPVYATFKLVSPSTYVVAGEEDGNDDENAIRMVEFYMFDFNGTRDEKTSAYNYSYHKYEGAANSEISFVVKSGINKKILVAVNANLGELEGLDYEDAQQKIDALLLTNTNSQQIEAGKFVMSGKVTATIEEYNTENEVTVKISRVVSKIQPPVISSTFKVLIPDEDLQTLFDDETVNQGNVQFSLTSYALINGYNKSYVFTYYNDDDKEGLKWTKWNPGGTYLKSTYDENGDLTMAYSGEQNGSPWLTDLNVFVYEMQPEEIQDQESGIIGYRKNQVYAFLIYGKLTDTVSGASVDRYWRVNLIRDDNYKIFRNTIYRVTLTEVRTPGYGTSEEGDDDDDSGTIVPRNDQTGIQATIELLPWRIRTQHTDF